MNLSQMKEIARSNGIEFHNNATAKKMREVLEEHNIPIPETDLINEKVNNYSDNIPPAGEAGMDMDSGHISGGIIPEHHPENYNPNADTVEMDFDEEEDDDDYVDPSYQVRPARQKNGLMEKFKWFMKQYREVTRRKKDPMREANLNILHKEKEVIKAKAIKQGNSQVYRKMLEWERSRRLIKVVDEYALNEMESAEINDICVCFNQMVSGRKVKLGQECRYRYYFDDSRQDDVYMVYVERTIEPEEQIAPTLERKLRMGFVPEPKDYAEPKTLIHSFTLVATEFDRHFKIQD